MRKHSVVERVLRGGKQRLRVVRARLRRLLLRNTRFIAITGSCGKTSTTSFLSHILSTQGNCYTGIDKNTRPNLIKTILRTEYKHDYLVQEVSAEKPGSLAEVLPIIRPQIGIVTRVGRDHHTNFRTLENTAKEKGALVECLPSNGVAVLKADDPHVINMSARTKAAVISYGKHEDADLQALDIYHCWPDGLSFTVTYKGQSVPVKSDLFGTVWVDSLLAAIAGAIAAGVEFEAAVTAIGSVKPFDRRMSIHRLDSGVYFINDAFKSSHWTTSIAIASMQEVEAPRTTIVLGSFSDSPGSASNKYRRLAKYALELVDRVIITGPNARYVKKLITPETEKRLYVIEDIHRIAELIGESAIRDEVIFIKGIHKEHLERLIYGQERDFRCWVKSCKDQTSCHCCKESGIDARA
jgi:UDP-N-acetylmuramoyl-tripeptide--D-alanyl-D-alanine ligase